MLILKNLGIFLGIKNEVSIANINKDKILMKKKIIIDIGANIGDLYLFHTKVV